MDGGDRVPDSGVPNVDSRCRGSSGTAGKRVRPGFLHPTWGRRRLRGSPHPRTRRGDLTGVRLWWWKETRPSESVREVHWVCYPVGCPRRRVPPISRVFSERKVCPGTSLRVTTGVEVNVETEVRVEFGPEAPVVWTCAKVDERVGVEDEVDLTGGRYRTRRGLGRRRVTKKDYPFVSDSLPFTE